MLTICYFAQEMEKIAAAVPPVTVSSYGKSTKGVVSKPNTKIEVPAVKTPQISAPANVPSSGKMGKTVDPGRSNTPPPPVYGGSHVQ